MGTAVHIMERKLKHHLSYVDAYVRNCSWMTMKSLHSLPLFMAVSFYLLG
jgi:hypothetical protein